MVDNNREDEEDLELVSSDEESSSSGEQSLSESSDGNVSTSEADEEVIGHNRIRPPHYQTYKDNGLVKRGKITKKAPYGWQFRD